jgi:hypothetical protein
MLDLKLITDTLGVKLPEIEGFFPSSLALSRIQIRSFVLRDNEFPTAFSKAQQCKLEIFHRMVDLMNMAFDARLAELRREKYLAEAQEKTGIEREMALVYAQREEFKRWTLLQMAQARAKEVEEFWQVYKECVAAGGDPEDPAEREAKEAESWAKRMELDQGFWFNRYLITPDFMREKLRSALAVAEKAQEMAKRLGYREGF